MTACISHNSDKGVRGVCAHAAAPTEADYAQHRAAARVISPVDAPQTAEDAALDTLDFVNLRVFGNTAFRQQQREVIEAVLKVWAWRCTLILCPVFACVVLMAMHATLACTCPLFRGDWVLSQNLLPHSTPTVVSTHILCCAGQGRVCADAYRRR